MNAVTLNGDDFDRIEVFASLEKGAIEPFTPTPNGIASPASSIYPSHGEEERAPRNRPQLDPPQAHYMLDLLAVHQKLEDVVVKEIGLFKAQSKRDLAEIEQLDKEKEIALRKHAHEVAVRNHWSVLGTVSQYLAAGASIAIGTTISATTPWMGAILVVSGLTGIANRVVQDVVGWESVISWFTKSVEFQKRLAHQIELGMIYFEIGTSLIGAVGGCYQGAFTLASASANPANRLALARKAAGTIQAVGTTLNMTSRLGKGFVDQRMDTLQSRLKILDAQSEQIRMEMTQQVTHTTNLVKTAQDIGNAMHQAIAASVIQDL